MIDVRKSVSCALIPLVLLSSACAESPTAATLKPVFSEANVLGDMDDDGVPDATDVEPTLTNIYTYVDWTAANPGAGTASGTITLPNGHVIGVQLRVLNPNGTSNSFYFGQTSGGTPWWTQSGPSPYVSKYVLNPPPPSDIIALIGGNTSSYVITFSEPVQDPIMDILSLGNGGDDAVYDFDKPFQIISEGRGWWGGCADACLNILPGEQLQGWEGHGTIRFIGSFPTFSWSAANGEFWHAFTLGVRGAADPNVDHDGDGIPDARDNCPLVANAGQEDSDFDGVGNACDTVNDGNVDTDGDGLTNAEEHEIGTSPTNPDTDGDGLNDKVDPNPLGDLSPPVITATVTGTLGANGWYTSDVGVSWTVVDGESAITLKTGCTTSSVTTDTNGQTFTCTAKSAGGTATQSVTIKRDATAPVVSGSQLGLVVNGWHVGDVIVSFEVTDGTSGIATTSAACAGVTITSDTPGVTYTCSVTDNAGNSASDDESLKRDATPPVVALVGNAGTYTVDQTINITCTASDALSGLRGPCTGGLTGPAYNYIGVNQVHAGATDNAGNSFGVQGTFTVTLTSGSLCNLVRQWVSQKGVANSMCQQLANEAYGAFRNHVSAQSGKFVSDAHAAILIELSRAL